MRLDGLAAARWATAIVGVWGLLAASAFAQAEPTFDELVAPWKKDAGAETFEKAWEAADEQVQKRVNSEALRTLEKSEAAKKKHAADRDAAEAAALPLLKKAVALIPPVTDENRENVLSAMTSLGYFTFQQKDYLTAAIVSEHLARTFKDHASALQAAQVAMASRASIYNAVNKDQAAGKEQKAAALDKLAAICEFIGQSWPDRPEGAEAYSTLGQLALAAGDTKKLEAILAKLPPESPARWEIGLRNNLVEWSELLKQRSLPAGDPNKPADLDKRVVAFLAKLKENTTKYRATNGGGTTMMLLAGELTAVQAHNMLGQPEEALKILKIPNTGLIAEANSNSQAVQEGAFGAKIYQEGLQAYLATGDLDQAEAMAEKMSGGAGDATALLKLRLSLAKRLVDDLAKLRDNNGDPAQIEKFLASLTKLLKKVTGEAQTADFPSVAWAGQTLIKLADDADAGGVEPSPAVKELYTLSADVFEKLQQRSAAGAKDSNEAKALNSTKVYLAKSYRRLGKYQQALDLLEGVLKESSNNLDAQITAAQTYQDWGAATNKAEYFNNAVFGGPDKKVAVGIIKSPIMGWSKLASKLQGSSVSPERVFEVRYNLAFSVASAALLSTKKSEQTSGLQAAESQIMAAYRFGKELGGPKQKDKFTQLLKTVQGKLGKPETGFPTGDDAAPAANAKPKG